MKLTMRQEIIALLENSIKYIEEAYSLTPPNRHVLITAEIDRYLNALDFLKENRDIDGEQGINTASSPM